MYKNLLFRLVCWVILWGLPSLVLGQAPNAPTVVSPQFHPDNTVTFRYLAPSAKEVKLNAQFEKEPVQMTKDAAGIWSITVGPVKPDM